jgi:hypothetical protein
LGSFEQKRALLINLAGSACTKLAERKRKAAAIAALVV